MKHDAALEVFADEGCQALKTLRIGRGDRAGGLDLGGPDLVAAAEDAIHLDLILVPVVPEADVGIGAIREGDELLENEGFKKVAEAMS